MIRRDPLELLATMSPMPDLVERLPGDSDMVATIVSSTFMTKRVSTQRRVRGRLWIAGGSAVAVVVLAALTFLQRQAPQDPLRLVCFPVAASSPAYQFGIPMTDDPIESCQNLWRNGAISRTGAPALTGCVLDTGIVAVVPGDREVCAELGMANWVGQLSVTESNLLAFQDELVMTFLDRCIVEPDVDGLLRDLMVRYGLSDWRVESRGGYAPDRQCTFVSAEPAQKLVVIASRRGIP